MDRGDFTYPGFTHDHAICQMVDGVITGYLQLERHTRRKYDNQLHLHIEDILDNGWLIEPENATWIGVNSFVGNSFISRNGRFRLESRPRKHLRPQLHPASAHGEFRPYLGKALTAFSIDHELAHVAANLPFHGAFRENSLLIHFDGGASLSNCSVWIYRKGKINLVDAHWRLGHLSKIFNDNALSFKMLGHTPGEHCAVPGKLMGFATLGKASSDKVEWLRTHDHWRNIWQDEAAFHAAARSDFGWQGRLGDTRDPFLQDLAASLQDIFIEEWLTFLHETQAQTQADHLYLSGGCALNILANTRIVESGLFADVFIPPCPGDSGLALGATAYHQWSLGMPIAKATPYLNNLGLNCQATEHDRETIQTLGDLIAAGKVLGLYQGAGEAGPRALGHRSLIARPDSKELAQHVSMTCKGREWYRPIAPVMRERQALRLTGLPAIHHLSRYMLLDFSIPHQHQAEIAGVVHANGTARIQALFDRADEPLLWDLLAYLEERHRIPALINTSFNAQGEPIVHTPEQARASAISMGLDAVCIHSQLEILHSPQSQFA